MPNRINATCTALDKKVRFYTVQYTMVFVYSDWLYFDQHIYLTIFFILEAVWVSG